MENVFCVRIEGLTEIFFWKFGWTIALYILLLIAWWSKVIIAIRSLPENFCKGVSLVLSLRETKLRLDNVLRKRYFYHLRWQIGVKVM